MSAMPRPGDRACDVLPQLIDELESAGVTDGDLAAHMGSAGWTFETLRAIAKEATKVGPGPLAKLRELARSTRAVAAPAGASADDREERAPPWPHASHWAKPDKTDDTYGAGAHAAALEAMAQRIEDGRVPEALLALHLAGVSAEALRAMAADPRVHATVDLHEALTKINSHADDYEALGGDEQAQHAFLGKVWAPKLHECVTEFVAVSGCGKTFTENAQDPDGPVSKASEVRVGRMSARTRHVPDLRSLAAVLAETLQRPNAGLILDPFKGSYPGDVFSVVSIPDLAGQLGVQAAGGEVSEVDRPKLVGFHTLNGLRCAARMKESVLAGHVAVVDRDVDEHTPEHYNAQNLPFGPWLLLVDEKILPGAAQAGYVRVPSSSARVLRHDGRVVGGGNGHVYFITERFEDKPIIAAEAPHVAAREGVAWPKPRMSKATGKPLDSHTTTTIIDPSVFWPGRLVFEGLPHVSGRLRVGPAKVEVREGPPLDLGRFRRMTDADTATFNSASVGARLERGRDGAVALQDDKLLTLDTIIEPKGHAPMTVAEWRTQFNGRKTRIQAPFRVSTSYAAFIWEESGQVRVHDSGDNTTYRLAGPRPEDVFSPVTGDDLGPTAGDVFAQATAAKDAAQRKASGADFLDGIDVTVLRADARATFHQEPVPPDVLAYPLLVRGRLAILSGDGGTGKSMYLLGLAHDLGSGTRLVAHESPASGPVGALKRGVVLFLTAEDGTDDLQWRRAKYRERARHMSKDDDDCLARLEAGLDNTILVSTADVIVNLYTSSGSTEAMTALESLCRRVQGLDALIIDPVSGFSTIDPNSAEAFGGFVKALRAIAARLDIAVVLLHHVSKGSVTNAASTGEDLSHHASLGSVMGNNSARVGAVMQRMTKKAAPEWGVTEEDAHRYVGLSAPKTNGVQPLQEPVWFKNEGGVLIPATLERSSKTAVKDAAKAETLAQKARQLNWALLDWADTRYKKAKPPSKTELVERLRAHAACSVVLARQFVADHIDSGTLVMDAVSPKANASHGCVRPGELGALRKAVQAQARAPSDPEELFGKSA